MTKDPRISHLTEVQINELIKRYYAKENVNSLIQEFKIDVTASNLFRVFPQIELEEICPYCDEFLLAKYPSKSAYIGTVEDGNCPSCKHSNSDWCRCSNCREISEQNKRIAAVKKKDELSQLLSLNQHNSFQFAELNFEQRVYLGALIREGMVEDFTLISPINRIQPNFTPDRNLTNNILQLISKDSDLIVIHPDTDPNFIIDIVFEDGRYSYYPLEVAWALNVDDEELDHMEICNRLMNPKSIHSTELEKAFELWNEVALYECIEYLIFSIDSIFNTDYNIGDKTLLTFKDLLNEFSVSQIYGIIYKATNNALRFQAEKKVSRKHAINSILGGCRSFGERALANKWEISKYHRIKTLPQSGLSKFVYERILKVGDNGFYNKPDANLIQTKKEYRVGKGDSHP